MAERGSIGRIATISRGPSIGGLRGSGGERAFSVVSRSPRVSFTSGIGATRVPSLEARVGLRPVSSTGNSGTGERPAAPSFNRSRLERISIIQAPSRLGPATSFKPLGETHFQQVQEGPASKESVTRSRRLSTTLPQVDRPGNIRTGSGEPPVFDRQLVTPTVNRLAQLTYRRGISGLRDVAPTRGNESVKILPSSFIRRKEAGSQTHDLVKQSEQNKSPDKRSQPRIVWIHRAPVRETTPQPVIRNIPEGTREHGGIQDFAVPEVSVLSRPVRPTETAKYSLTSERAKRIRVEIARIYATAPKPIVEVPTDGITEVTPIVPLTVPDGSRSAVLPRTVGLQADTAVQAEKLSQRSTGAAAYLYQLLDLNEKRRKKDKKKKSLLQRVQERITKLQQKRKEKTAVVAEPLSVTTINAEKSPKAAVNKLTDTEALTNSQKKRARVKQMLSHPLQTVKKIFFSVDEPTKRAREQTALNATQILANANGMVNGIDVAASIGNESREDLISALLRQMGYDGLPITDARSKASIDGSLVRYKNNIASAGIQDKGAMNKIIKASSEDALPVKASEDKSGRPVGKKEVDLVLNGAQDENSLAAA